MSKNLTMQALQANSYLSGGNADYLEDLYEQFLKDPRSVDADWRTYFESLPQVNGLATQDISHADIRKQFLQFAQQPAKRQVSTTSDDAQFERKQAAVDQLIQAYRTYGHLLAKINPIGNGRVHEPQLDLAYYPDLTASDMERSFRAQSLLGKSTASLKEILAFLTKTYCGSLGTEYMYIRDPVERAWVQQRLEGGRTSFSPAAKKKILAELIAADGLEKFLGSKYVGQKRFSLEGGDSFIPFVHALNDQAAAGGVQEVLVGMAHRGRLNVLINIFGKPSAELFQEFEGRKDYGVNSGDVKYHLGYASDIATPAGPLHLSLAFNPSHLEIISAVLMGSVRAREQRRSDGPTRNVMGLVVHGDASFSGQGIVMETLNMSQTNAYQIGGVVHIVINNQVGFTTSNPTDARSGIYCTDPAKMIDAPVFHVNGDDPEAVVWVAQMAVDYRNRFHKDVVVDLVCYRRWGHNEADEPSATQPLMYDVIRQHLAPRELYAQQLVAEKVCTQAEVDAMVDAYRQQLDAGKSVVATLPDGLANQYISSWKPYIGQSWRIPAKTAVPHDKLIALGQKLSVLPEGFEVQRQVSHTLETRSKMFADAQPLDWGAAEILAYATLLTEGHAVRMSGQDCRRGTFAHRHAALHDQKTGQSYTPLAHLAADQANFSIYDSLLSEAGAMGFEYGYASTDSTALVLWEAQYGDFANGAQVIIDQFISSAWQKWQTLCGLTLLLPHGYEGAGPEHSSARLERYLQLCAEDNIQVCTPTTPAQIFHLLRRQVVRAYRAPLIVMSPKSMLRNKLAVSPLSELAEGSFQLVIPEIDKIAAKGTRRVVLCGGKVYYDLLTKRRENKCEDVVILRIEQLYPFPLEEVKAQLAHYKATKEVVWCQEEPQNQGAWFTIRHYLEQCLAKDQQLKYVGRAASASSAAGYAKLHNTQQAALVEEALK